jgi:hypothetical protein
VAVGRKEVAELIEGQSEWVHLSVRVVFNTRTVELHAVGIAGIEVDFVSVAALDVRVIVVTVGTI